MAPACVEAEEVYDYIVCGGGTSGCVIAGRLAEDLNATILVLEAGPDNADLENVHMAGGWSQNFDSETDWNIVTEHMPTVNNRQVKCSRGRFLGGSSGVNGTLCIRGTKQDYDDWCLDEWTGEKMWTYMAKAETFHDKDWFKADASVHGESGPLHTEPHDLAPISELFKESMIDQGLPYHSDMFSTGETPQGCGDVLRTVHQGIRSTAADFITKGYRRENVTIKTDATVDKILLEKKDGDLTATGVLTVSKDGQERAYYARKEVIISAGAYCSPTILMRSGIGAKDELEEHGIDCVVDLPGVGKNLMDHVLCFIFYEVSKPHLTNDHLVYHNNAFTTSYALYREHKTGVLSTFPFGIFGYARLDSRLASSPLWTTAPRKNGRDPMGLAPSQPNIEFWNTELYGGPKQFTDFPVEDGKSAFAICVLLFNQRSRGTVALRSKECADNPFVDHNYLADDLDMLVLSEGCRMANEIVMKGRGTRDVVRGSWPEGEGHHRFETRDEWVPYIRQHATTCYHASGTCKMGAEDDKMAVLDSRLRVKGVRGLRVADVSVVPKVNNGHTQMVAYGIGEGAAEMIKEDAKKGQDS
ncbi:glucose-methanol-choline oxidoreductase-like protein [Lojkania enalia]|uniref:Glucose-methanol-choline oxidoreductase-like protein n=1 Tax=Lojkania enalia TaxID=147567 RepID=A0A9P4K2I7_9PLEO|nr:glucose-methanol-choline oxidoreductase-like protein [Didymosphaeria enalia]